MQLTKICSKCGIEKSIDVFGKDKSKKSGIRNECKSCKRLIDNAWKSDNKEKISIYMKKRWVAKKEDLKPINKQWKKDNPEKSSVHNKKWQNKNIELCKNNSKKWFEKNPGKRVEYSIKRNKYKDYSTPKWSKIEAVNDFYNKAKRLTNETGIKHNVDHIVPLIGKINKIHVVCGLHCESNLQVLTQHDNFVKNNVVWPDMP